MFRRHRFLLSVPVQSTSQTSTAASTFYVSSKSTSIQLAFHLQQTVIDCTSHLLCKAVRFISLGFGHWGTVVRNTHVVDTNMQRAVGIIFRQRLSLRVYVVRSVRLPGTSHNAAEGATRVASQLYHVSAGSAGAWAVAVHGRMQLQRYAYGTSKAVGRSYGLKAQRARTALSGVTLTAVL